MSMETSLIELRERILAANAARAPLRLRGGGSKDFYGEALAGEVLDTRGHVGIIDYEPSERVRDHPACRVLRETGSQNTTRASGPSDDYVGLGGTGHKPIQTFLVRRSWRVPGTTPVRWRTCSRRSRSRVDPTDPSG